MKSSWFINLSIFSINEWCEPMPAICPSFGIIAVTGEELAYGTLRVTTEFGVYNCPTPPTFGHLCPDQYNPLSPLFHSGNRKPA
jgi:hypothetical protein